MRALLGLIFSAFLLTPTAAEAVVKTEAKVRYQTASGPSKWYPMQVNFATGTELYQSSGNLSFSTFKNYAIVFWSQSEVTVIEIGTFMICSGEFTETCLPLLGRMNGKDAQGREWEICTAIFC